MLFHHTTSTRRFRLTLCSLAIASTLSACSFMTEQDKQAQQAEQSNSSQQVSPPPPVYADAIAMQAAAKQQHLREAARVSAEQRQVSGMQMLSAPSHFAYQQVQPVYNEKYQHVDENRVKAVSQEPVSTFSIDVDTGSYSNVRRMLNQGILPPADAVRIEEFINYFDYQYPLPAAESAPFSVSTNIAVSPWDEHKHLMRIALKGYTPEVIADSGRNLVFLLDVSGSMAQPDKLPLLTRSLNMLSQQLTERDRVAIVVYAGASGVVLEPTKGNEQAKIAQALMQLQAGGATNGQAGIELAYSLAEQSMIKDGVNRVILATDGDFNVGIRDHDQLIELIKRKKDKGIALTTLGFGQGNYNDALMEQLADAGNGNYAYIDTIHEARKVLVDELSATLMTIAKDVKVQVEFNPANVSEYRLIGYENRALNQEDFNNDKVDAGEIGAGHTVTAFYEVSLTGSANPYLPQLRYGVEQPARHPNDSLLTDELAWVKLRYKPVSSEQSVLLSQPVKKQQITDFKQQNDDFRFAAAVLGFAHKLKGSHYLDSLDYQQLAAVAKQAMGQDTFGYRAEFIQLLNSTASLQAQIPAGPASDNDEQLAVHAILNN